MKKLTVYRHGAYDKNLNLKAESAYDLYTQAKKLREEAGNAEVIFSSPIKRAVHTATVLKLAMKNATLVFKPSLADNNPGGMFFFKEYFPEELARFYADTQHVILVSHEPNIAVLANMELYMGTAVIFEAECWDDIFSKHASRLTLFSAVETQGYISPSLLPQEKATIDAVLASLKHG